MSNDNAPSTPGSMNSAKPVEITTKASSRSDSRPAETYKQRTVRIMYNDGRLDCGDQAHFNLVSKPGQQYKTPAPVSSRQIVDGMKIGVDAKCPCERKAIKEAWGWNTPGVFETEWVTPGSFHKGYGKYDPSLSPRRVMPLYFTPSKEDIAHLHSTHPGWLFVPVSGNLHDHGVAHATTQIGSYNLLHGLPKGRWLDLHGNPTANEQFNAQANGRTIETLVNIESSKDVLRSRTKWGVQKQGDKVRYHVGALRDLHRDKAGLLGSVKGCVSIHTLYYYEPSEIPSFLAKTGNKVMHAMLHRFKGDSGTMNNGEQKWRRIPSEVGRDLIEQTNIRTGEKYTHLDPEIWFENHSWTPQRDLSKMRDPKDLHVENSLVWDGNMCADGTYRLTITTCTPLQAALDTSYVAPPPRAEAPVNSVEYVTRYSHVILDGLMGSQVVSIPPSVLALFTEGRRRMLGAQRDAAKFRSHCQWVGIKSKSVMSAAKIDDIQAVYDVAYASFWVDAHLDRKLQAQLNSDVRKLAIDTIVLALGAKTFASGTAELLRTIRTHV